MTYKYTLITILVLLIPLSLLASTTGKIAGQAVDGRTGEPLAGVNLILDDFNLGSSTDDEGFYFILNVPPGNHRVTAQYLGYRTVTQVNVIVQVDRTTPLNFSLETETLELGEAIVVEAVQPEVQRDATSTRVNISSKDIEKLPLNSVNQLLEIQTGVVSSGGLHVRGGRSGELAYLIDGHRIEDPLFGGNYTDINTEAIEQMELITGTFNAEYGNAMSGVVNIVTRESLGRLQGRVRYKMTKLGLGQAGDNLNDRFTEGFLSGPLWPGSRIGFTVSGKMTRADNYYQSGSLTAEGLPSGQFSGKAFGYNNLTSAFTKLYFRPFRTAKFSLSYNYDDREWQNYVHSYKYIPDSTYVRNSGSHLVAANFTHTLSPRLYYEVRLSYYQYEFLRTYGDLHYTQFSAAASQRYPQGEWRLSAGNEEYIDQKVKTYTARTDVTFQYNRFNLFRAGVEFKQHDLDYFWIFGPRRSPENQYINDFQKLPYEGALYIQDKIEFESIILNTGLRFDYYHPRVTYIADPNNRDGSVTKASIKTQLSPRLGVAYPITENMVFHFAYGHFFQRPTFEVIYEDLSRNMDVNKPLIGNPDLKPQNTVSYELGVNTKITDRTTLQSTVFSKKIKDLIGVAWQFKVPGVPLQYAYYVNEDFAYVKGFELNLRYRGRIISLGANYTYSIAEGSSSSQQERFTGAFDVKGRQSLQFYPLSFDQRHMVNSNLTFNFGRGEGPFNRLSSVFQNSYLSLLFRYGSGLPFTYNPTRKRYEPDLNNARMPYIYTIDLDAEKRFPLGPANLGVFMQIYNLLDRQNVRSVYSATGKPDDFGEFERASYEYMADPTNYFPSRAFYLGISLGF